MKIRRTPGQSLIDFNSLRISTTIIHKIITTTIIINISEIFADFEVGSGSCIIRIAWTQTYFCYIKMRKTLGQSLIDFSCLRITTNTIILIIKICVNLKIGSRSCIIRIAWTYRYMDSSSYENKKNPRSISV